MRGQPGPCLAIGNYPAARRRKPPPIILWSIGIITCLLMIGAAAMLTVGYLNPFGTVGLAILGVGAVVYFGAILFLVLSCLWVERKYPGMQPLSFKIYSRKPNRIPVPPTTFVNPNVSGQLPVDTTPNYRPHKDLPIQVSGLNDEEGTTDKSQEKKDNPSSHGYSPGHAKNPKAQATVLDIVQEEDQNGVMKDDNPDIRLQEQTNNDDINMNEDTRANLISTAEMKEESQTQQEQLKTIYGEDAAETHDIDQNKTAHIKQHDDVDNVSIILKRERKVKFKTHHIEVPFEDYPSSDSSSSLSNKKDKSQDIQEADNSQNISTSTENENSSTTGASKYPSSTKSSAIDKPKEASSSVNNLSHTSKDHPHQRAKTAALSAVNAKDVKQEPSNPSSRHISRFIGKDEKLQDGAQSTSSSQSAGSSPVHARKLISGGKQLNYEESSHRVRGLTSTNSASPPAVRKVTQPESQASKPIPSVPKDSAQMPKSSSLSSRNLLAILKNNITNPDHTQESVQERSSSPLNTGENIVPHKNNLGNNQQNIITMLKHHTQNPGPPGGSPTHAQNVQSLETAQKLRKDEAVRRSPPANRKAESSPSSPARHHQNRTDNLSKAQRTQEQSITILTSSSSERKEEIQKKKILHASSSSDFPSSSSSSPPKQHQGSPNSSPRLPRNRDHTSKTAAFHSSPRNEEFSNIQSHQSSRSSSSDVSASPSSSPRRTHEKRS